MKLIENGVEVELSEETVNNLRKLFKEKKSFRPIEGDDGYYIYGDGDISRIGRFSKEIIEYYNNGNWRSTLEGTQYKIAYDRALQRIREWKTENCEEWKDNDTIYFIEWNITSFTTKRYTCFSVDKLYHTGNPIGIFYCYLDTELCIKACHDDLLTVIRDGYK